MFMSIQCMHINENSHYTFVVVENVDPPFFIICLPSGIWIWPSIYLIGYKLLFNRLYLKCEMWILYCSNVDIINNTYYPDYDWCNHMLYVKYTQCGTMCNTYLCHEHTQWRWLNKCTCMYCSWLQCIYSLVGERGYRASPGNHFQIDVSRSEKISRKQ
jgi:hypothetical protein